MLLPWELDFNCFIPLKCPKMIKTSKIPKVSKHIKNAKMSKIQKNVKSIKIPKISKSQKMSKKCLNPKGIKSQFLFPMELVSQISIPLGIKFRFLFPWELNFIFYFLWY